MEPDGERIRHIIDDPINQYYKILPSQGHEYMVQDTGIRGISPTKQYAQIPPDQGTIYENEETIEAEESEDEEMEFNFYNSDLWE